MKHTILAFLLIAGSLLLAQTAGRKAKITTVDGTVQELTIVQESMDSIKVKVLESVMTMPKSNISSIGRVINFV